jgi:thiol:disulfide interchange protein
MSRRVRPLSIALFALILVSIPCFAEVAWVKSYDTALKQAAAENKFVVIDISASWCGYCRRMAREVYPDGEFVEFSRQQVFVRLFADTDPEGTKLAEKFRVRGFPTIVVVNSEGVEVGRVVGARPAKRLIQDLNQIFGNE